MVQEIKTKVEFDNLLKESGSKLVMVDFFANWCGPCKHIAPRIVAMAEEFKDVVFVKVDVDENGETAEEQGISAMPTFKFYKNGKEVAEVVGASEADVRAAIAKHK